MQYLPLALCSALAVGVVDEGKDHLNSRICSTVDKQIVKLHDTHEQWTRFGVARGNTV